MLRTTTLAVSLALLAGVAQAQDYTIRLQDKSPAQVEAELGHAAAAACREAYTNSMDAQFDFDNCVNDTVHAVHVQLRAKVRGETQTDNTVIITR